MITILETGLGNPQSVRNMLSSIGLNARLGHKAGDIEQTEALILPGVGAFDKGMAALEDLQLVEPIRNHVQSGKALLGICLGAQLLMQRSEEGEKPGLSLIKGQVKRFQIKQIDKKLKVPHMGWNRIEPCRPSPLFDGLDSEGEDAMRFYHVHSYHIIPDDEADILATARHGIRFNTILQHGSVTGMQFHPEKSHRFGKTLLGNYFKGVAGC